MTTFHGTRRPDVLIECGPRDDRSLAASEQRVVIEVLSPSTTKFGRFEKLAECQAHDAIQVIPCWSTLSSLAHPFGAASPPAIGARISQTAEALVPLPAVGTELRLSELYLDLTFDD